MNIKKYIPIIIAEIIFFLGVVISYTIALKNQLYSYPFALMITMFIFCNLFLILEIRHERKLKKVEQKNEH